MNILNINDSTVQQLFNENKEYINMNIIGSLNLCYLKCNQSIDLCEDLTIKRIINYGNCLILEFNRSECALDIKFNDVENNGKFNFEKIIITTPSLHSISNTNESMEIFFLFNGKVKKDENEKELIFLLSVLVTTTTDVVNDPFNKLMSQLFADKSKIPNSDPDNNIINYIKPNSHLAESGMNQNISPLIDLESFIPNIGDRSFFDFSNDKNVHFRVFKTVKELSNLTYSNISAVLKPINIKKSEPPANLTIYFHQDFDEEKEKYLTLETIKDLDKELDKELEDKTVEQLLCNVPSDNRDSNQDSQGKTDSNKKGKSSHLPDCFHTYDEEDMIDYTVNPGNNSGTNNYKKEIIWFNVIVAIIVLIFYIFSTDLKYISEYEFKKNNYEGERSLCRNFAQTFSNRRRTTLKDIIQDYIIIILYIAMSITFNIMLFKNSPNLKGILIRSNIVYFILVFYAIFKYVNVPSFMDNPLLKGLIYLWNYLTCAPDRISKSPSTTQPQFSSTSEQNNDENISSENLAIPIESERVNELLTPPIGKMIGGSSAPSSLATSSSATSSSAPSSSATSSLSNTNRRNLYFYAQFIYLLVVTTVWTFMITDYKRMPKLYRSFAVCNIIIIGIIIVFSLILKSGVIIEGFLQFVKGIYARGLKNTFGSELPNLILGKLTGNTLSTPASPTPPTPPTTSPTPPTPTTSPITLPMIPNNNLIGVESNNSNFQGMLDEILESATKNIPNNVSKQPINVDEPNNYNAMMGQILDDATKNIPKNVIEQQNNNADSSNDIMSDVTGAAAGIALETTISSDQSGATGSPPVAPTSDQSGATTTSDPSGATGSPSVAPTSLTGSNPNRNNTIHTRGRTTAGQTNAVQNSRVRNTMNGILASAVTDELIDRIDKSGVNPV